MILRKIIGRGGIWGGGYFYDNVDDFYVWMSNVGGGWDIILKWYYNGRVIMSNVGRGWDIMR